MASTSGTQPKSAAEPPVVCKTGHIVIVLHHHRDAMQWAYQFAGRCQGIIQRGRVRQRVGIANDDRSQLRAFPVIRRDPVEMCLADGERCRPAVQIGRMQRSDRRLLDSKRRGVRGLAWHSSSSR